MNKYQVTALIVLFLSPFFSALADDGKSEFNPLIYGVPSLTIAPDARAGGMGDVGAATEPDIFSQHWNPAKYAFSYSKAGIGLSYTPWLRSLVSDIDLAYLAGFYKLGDADRHAVGASLRYFSLGEIEMRDRNDDIISNAKPYELAFDVSYSLKFTETFSGAATFRYIYSDLGTQEEDLEPASAWAADVAGYYNNYVMVGNSECLLGLGFNISNIGTKISYDGNTTKNFLPTNMRLGGSLLYPMDDYNTISFNLDVSKYLIPATPETKDLTEDERKELLEEYYDISPISGIFKSFEQFSVDDLMFSFGAEYAYDNKFFVRGGYFHESEKKGNRRYFTAGAGFKLTAFQLDAAYLISTVPSNPLDQTIRFTLSFDMDGLKNLMR